MQELQDTHGTSHISTRKYISLFLHTFTLLYTYSHTTQQEEYYYALHEDAKLYHCDVIIDGVPSFGIVVLYVTQCLHEASLWGNIHFLSNALAYTTVL